MEAKDTIMKNNEDRMAMSDIKNRWIHSQSGSGYIKINFEHDCIDEIINTQRHIQAEISFKAGQESAGAISHFAIYNDGKRGGIRLVVDWINKYIADPFPYAQKEWQAFLESKGLVKK